MHVSDCMTREVRTIGPDQTLREAAEMMADNDVGALPVSDGDKLIGMITDRDISIRGVGEGRGPASKVAEVMSREVLYCFEDQDVEHVLRNMGHIQVRRLPVLSREKRMVGIVSLSDLATDSEAREAGEALNDITRRGGQHSQSLH